MPANYFNALMIDNLIPLKIMHFTHILISAEAFCIVRAQCSIVQMAVHIAAILAQCIPLLAVHNYVKDRV